MAISGVLRAGGGTDGYLRGEKYSPRIEGYLYAHNANPADGYLRPDGRPQDGAPVLSFPTQYPGLRVFKGTVQELCLVAIGDAPVGDQWRVHKNGTTYAVYLVETTDPSASHVRVRTSDGVKAARLKTT